MESASGIPFNPPAPVVAIDGPVASGKSTVGQAAARRLGLAFLDTGLMYRALTWLALRRGLSVDDAEAIVNLADCFPVEIVEDGSIAIAGCRPGDELHSPAVNRNVSAVSAISGVRRALVARQRDIAGESAGGIIMAGRDIGTVVLPDASIKLYIDAAPETRARRRMAQMYPDDASAGLPTTTIASSPTPSAATAWTAGAPIRRYASPTALPSSTPTTSALTPPLPP